MKMRQLINIMEYAHREESDSTFTHDGEEYNLNCVLSAAANIPTQMIPVSELVWIIPEGSWSDEDRIAMADLDAPLLITRWQNKLVVLDGWHRLQKAVRSGVPMIKTQYISPSFFQDCRL